ncbi:MULTISPECIES: FecCD family ABC transporter permease [Pseudobutyrivibrio]|uniref:Iron complex transport system permease protein n=2 Tax=Pseudobutyrivibrio xylanivorans TaxID=185007 RepID=A0A1M6BQ00_PSEXY|nr:MULTISPECIES: iron ABC transporter permease [Pseudobutyrivibrio]MDC7279688.1 iron ABC transporter permease [Butyrivibrio fibrisolvens]QFJ56405.1 iron ABC transporter permease [Pseudobutyrivibrio xylanivorans]SCZ77359.1 iron complex transport system permease protein [Pseudobutyrivibrio xylanivorans]SDH49338.1 iron complex transport system permease protein [Pseudobutyrivibrio sp. 49]SFN41048.1 iron complex transport system permease protein [Pseudobutyrivibrio sp. UC1225]
MIKNEIIFHGIKKRQKHYHIAIFIMFVILAILVCLNVTIGEKNYTLAEVVSIILNGENNYIIMKLRLPRTIAGIFCGIAFAIAGNTFQTLLGNPLASPDIIGVSSGSTVAAVFCILFLNLNRGIVSIISVVAGLLAAFTIYKLSCKNGFSNSRLILTGIGAQAFFTALINWMVMRAAEYDVPTAMRWMAGNLNGITTDTLPLLVIVVILAFAIMIYCNQSIRSLELGERYATILGVNVSVVRTLLMFCSVVLIAFATSISGPIASIAFLSGPIATRICSNNQTNYTSSALIGAILVIAGDFIGQNLLPTRYPVGIVTGLLGAPYLVYLLIRQNKGGVI